MGVELQHRGSHAGATLVPGEPPHRHVSVVRERLRGDQRVMEWEDTAAPRRVLIVSATMGEGHNAAGRGLEEAMRRLWPGAKVDWVDILDVMGPWVGPLFRSIYAINVAHTPWLYEFYYRMLIDHRWFANGSKRFIGSWAGRRLLPLLSELEPDLVCTTYPFGSAAMEWLRRHRQVTVPSAAWVPDFAPHPMWIYAGVTENLVLHQLAADEALAQVPEARVRVTGPPTSARFGPGDRLAARRALGLPPEAFVGLVSCGSLGFGHVAAAARDVLEAGPDTVAVVVCGRNEELRRSLLRGGDHGGRLRLLSWVDDVPALLRACDVVVTNAGGATCLEALACGRAILFHRPIAAHGKANARLLAKAGLTEICAGDPELVAAVRRLHENPRTERGLEERALAYATRRSIDDDLRWLARRLLEQSPRNASSYVGQAGGRPATTRAPRPA